MAASPLAAVSTAPVALGLDQVLLSWHSGLFIIKRHYFLLLLPEFFLFNDMVNRTVLDYLVTDLQKFLRRFRMPAGEPGLRLEVAAD